MLRPELKREYSHLCTHSLPVTKELFGDDMYPKQLEKSRTRLRSVLKCLDSMDEAITCTGVDLDYEAGIEATGKLEDADRVLWLTPTLHKGH